jgi:O-antigen/teichoic acid export membrane protein
MATHSSFGERAARAARSNVLLTPVIAVAGLTTSIVVVRTLSPAVFALYALALALRGGIQFVADLGFGGASSRTFAELHESGARSQAQRVFLRLAAIRAATMICLATVVAAVPGVFADLFNLHSGERYFLVFLVVIGTGEIAGGLGYYVLSGTLHHGTINKIALAQAATQPLLIIGAVASGFGLPGILGALAAGSILRAAALTVAALRVIRRIEDRGVVVEGMAATYTRVASASIVGKAAAVLHSRQVVTPIAFSAVARPQVAVFSVVYDWVHQLLTLASAPLYALLLPIFSAQRRDERFLRDFFRLVTRSLSLVVFPTAAILLAVFPSMAAVLLPSSYAGDQGTAVAFAAIFVPFVAIEFVLSGPATSLMLAHESFAGAYRAIKLVTAFCAVVYFATAGIDLLVVAGIMMAVRTSSALALHVELHNRLGLRIELAWIIRVIVASAVSGGLVVLVDSVLPGRAGDLVAGPAVGLATFLVLVRVARLLAEADAAIAARVLPIGRTPLRLLTHS